MDWERESKTDADLLPRIVAVVMHLQGYLIRLDPDARRRERRQERLRDEEDLCIDAYRRAGVPGVLREWGRIVDEVLVRTAVTYAHLLGTGVRGVVHMNIHDPQVQRTSATTFRRSLQTLLCIAVMQLSTWTMTAATHSGSTVLEVLTIIVAATSIVAAVVATGRELWALEALGKALLDSRG